LIGRLEKCDRPQVAFAHGKDWWRIGAGTLLVLSIVGTFSSRCCSPQKAQPSGNVGDAQDMVDFDGWLATRGG
jgi:hypothetical protein